MSYADIIQDHVERRMAEMAAVEETLISEAIRLSDFDAIDRLHWITQLDLERWRPARPRAIASRLW